MEETDGPSHDSPSGGAGAEEAAMWRGICRLVFAAAMLVATATACSGNSEEATTTSTPTEAFEFEPDEVYFMPVSAGPRTGDLDLSYEAVTTTAISFDTDGAAAASLLPPGFEPADPTTVLISHNEYEGTELEAGFDHNTLRVEIAVTHRIGETSLDGQFVLVLWDSSFASTLAGRELMGWPVLYDDVPDAWSDGGRRGFSVSEFGNILLEAEVSEMEQLDPAELADLEERVDADPWFTWRHFPSVNVTAADVSHPVRSGVDADLVEGWRGTAALRIPQTDRAHAAGSYSIINKLAQLPVRSSPTAIVTRGAGGFRPSEPLAPGQPTDGGFVFAENQFYLMPVSAGSRLGDANLHYEDVTTMTATFTTDGSVASLLPPGFALADPPTVSVRFYEYHGVGIMAGRDYNVVAVLVSATYAADSTNVEGVFVPVVWESSFGPVMSGREVLGWPKLMAEIPDAWSRDGERGFRASENGSLLVDVRLSELEPMDSDELARVQERENTTALLTWKYLPSIDGSGPDASYGTQTPFTSDLTEGWTGTAAVTFIPTDRSHAPLSYPIINKLAQLPIESGANVIITRGSANLGLGERLEASE
jgi:hypothetical protein